MQVFCDKIAKTLRGLVLVAYVVRVVQLNLFYGIRSWLIKNGYTDFLIFVASRSRKERQEMLCKSVIEKLLIYRSIGINQFELENQVKGRMVLGAVRVVCQCCIEQS